MRLNVIVILFVFLGCSFARAVETNWTVIVMGQVQRKQVLSIAPGTSLPSVIEQVGGVTRIGNSDKIEVLRKDADNKTNRMVVNLTAIRAGTQKFELRDHDVIKVPEKIF